MKEKNYIPDSEFKRLKKSDKLKIQPSSRSEEKVSKVLMIPIRKKMDGYGMSAFFALTENGWTRLPDYDCWKIYSGCSGGDFEYGGVVFFVEYGYFDLWGIYDKDRSYANLK